MRGVKTENRAELYNKNKEMISRIHRETTKSGQNIAPIPPVRYPEHRERAKRDFKFFSKRYFRGAFYLPWSKDHLGMIDIIEESVQYGGLFAYAMPRGGGKTTLAQAGAVWSILSGYRSFICLIGANDRNAKSLLEGIKHELRYNDLLLDDFPEVVYPLRRLGGQAKASVGQHIDNKNTNIVWTVDRVIFPTVKESIYSGCVIDVTSLEGSIRGKNHHREGGEIIRPDFCILDDPQTRQSAYSVTETQKRLDIIFGDVLHMGDARKQIASLCPCTKILPNDLACQLLDRDEHPEWRGQCSKMMVSFPKDMKIWEEYKGLLKKDNLEGTRETTAFYLENREKMDKGAEVSWIGRYSRGEISAVQHAMNLFFRDKTSFLAECQNEPISRMDDENAIQPTAKNIALRLSKLERTLIPVECNKIVVFIDVHKKLLYYVVSAFGDNFTGSVVDYGVYPPQKGRIFLMRDIREGLMSVSKEKSLEAAIYSGFEKLEENLLNRSWIRQDGMPLNVDICLIDAHWDQASDVAARFARLSNHTIYPSHGLSIRAIHSALGGNKSSKFERRGLNWIIRPNIEQGIRYIVYDTNFWKSFAHGRLTCSLGSPGAFTLFGNDPDIHGMFIDHLCSEKGFLTEGRDRTVTEWILKPGLDNHWLDGFVGTMVGASILGVKLPTSGTEGGLGNIISLKELQKEVRNATQHNNPLQRSGRFSRGVSMVDSAFR